VGWWGRGSAHGGEARNRSEGSPSFNKNEKTTKTKKIGIEGIETNFFNQNC